MFVICCTLFLLFGPAIQRLSNVRATGDEVFMWLRIVVLLIFFVDIATRCLLQENYFVLALCNNNTNSTLSRTGASDGGVKRPTCAIGNYLFWCDVISTMCILYDLSFINHQRFAMVECDLIVIDGFPDPESFSGYQFRRFAPNSLEFNVMIAMLRTLRCARYVRSRATMGISNRINFYGIYKLSRCLNPFYLYYRCQIKREAKQRSLDEKSEESTFLVVGGGEGVEDQGTTWSLKGVLTMIRADAEREALEGRQKLPPGPGAWEKLKSTLLLASDKSFVEKDNAAVKIQRAWRNRAKSEFRYRLEGLASRNQLAIPEQRTFLSENSGRINDSSRFLSNAGKGHGESQVASDMRELTGKRVAFATLILVLSTILCTYASSSTTQMKTMVVLHSQTMKPAYSKPSLEAAVSSSTPTLYKYRTVLGADLFPNPKYDDTLTLRERNIVKISVSERSLVGETSTGWFDNSKSVKRGAWVEIVATLCIILFWLTGVISFAGPVMVLAIAPVEQMVRLLSILTLDPLGYQSTEQYKEFLWDEVDLRKNTIWSKEVLKGMETSLLKSTILRIGSLMKVGFGSAGVEIIRNNLKQGHNENMLVLNSQGTTVPCIFLFCDIRQFTDATEQLQEEVFVFTNQTAAVVHSICNSYGGAANKNVGDAFLVSWSLDADGPDEGEGTLKATANQADKALLSVVKISIASTYDDFFLEPLSDAAKGRLKTKLKNRPGSVLQMGIGLHAGTAVQGAIGSQRKIDATYVAESVERTEFLESSTKKYGLKLMMSGEFHRLLNPRTQGRCRKIDRILIVDGDNAHKYQKDTEQQAEVMDLFTFDMDVDAIQRGGATRKRVTDPDTGNVSISGSPRVTGKRPSVRRRRNRFSTRISITSARDFLSSSVNKRNDNSNVQPVAPVHDNGNDSNNVNNVPELVLPNGPVRYSERVWESAEIRIIRDRYTRGNLFFEKYRTGLNAYYKKDWSHSERCFHDILKQFDDGPSRYFLRKMDETNGVPPDDFRTYGTAD